MLRQKHGPTSNVEPCQSLCRCGKQFRRAYDPLDPVEPEPWNGGGGFELDGAGLELGDAAGAGDAGFGVTWVVGAAGAGRGCIGDVPTCAGADEGADGPEGGGEGDTGRGGAGGGT